MTIFQTVIRASLAAAVAAFWSHPSLAVEGGTGAYLPGSRDTMAGFAPPPGTYFTIDVFHLDSTAPFLPINGVVLDEVTSSATVTKLNFTQSFQAPLWGGQPYVTVTIPYVNGSLSFAGELKNGYSGGFTDDQSGMGDLTITPALGYHSGNNHWVYAASVFVPTGYYEPASFDIPARQANVLSFGKNRWAITPTIAYTYLDMKTGLELSASGGITFSQKNPTTDYQTAPEILIEMAAMQHLKSGFAFGVTGYLYQQTADDSGSGADAVQNLTGAESLQASMQAMGPIISYNTKMGDTAVSMKLKYLQEFNAKRRFESNVWSASFNISF
jgi:hypothetical protein